MMRRIFLASPYTGNIPLNTAYARFCLRDSIDRGEAPFVAHLLYTQVLDDREAADRNLGIELGYVWIRAAHEIVFYTDLGMSPSMEKERLYAERHGVLWTLRGLNVAALTRLNLSLEGTKDVSS